MKKRLFAIDGLDGRDRPDGQKHMNRSGGSNVRKKSLVILRHDLSSAIGGRVRLVRLVRQSPRITGNPSCKNPDSSYIIFKKGQ